jgi:hypothetical protein
MLVEAATDDKVFIPTPYLVEKHILSLLYHRAFQFLATQHPIWSKRVLCCGLLFGPCQYSLYLSSLGEIVKVIDGQHPTSL